MQAKTAGKLKVQGSNLKTESLKLFIVKDEKVKCKDLRNPWLSFYEC